MFQNKRFATAGVNAAVDLLLQLYLWNLIDEFEKDKEQDYIQIFDLSVVEKNGCRCQRIIHSQEMPDYQREHLLELSSPIEVKIYAIDDEDHSTMMLAEEY